MKSNYELTKEQRAEHEKTWGGFNDFPPGWCELTEKEFAQSAFFTYNPEVTEYRQMLPRSAEDPRVRDHVKPPVRATLYFMSDNTGYAMSADYWAGRITYYRFGCAHQWGDASEEIKRRRVTLHRCESAYYCVKCGHFAVVDSSD